MAGARVRRLRARDIDRAIELTDLEGWGYTREDFRLLLALSPDGCFAAEADGTVVGILSTTPHGPLAFLGAVVVDARFRNQGIGARLMEAALDHLERSGIETVRLNAYLHVAPFYEKLGFRTEFENIRWEGPRVDPRAAKVRALDSRGLENLFKIDEASFGASRKALLTRLATDFSETFLVAEDDGNVTGYLVGNAQSPAIEIGPWVVEPRHAEGAADLFYGLMARTSGTSYAFTAPTPNRRVHDFARGLGYHEVFRTVRMRRGKDAYGGRPEAIWGFAGLEKG